MSRTSSPRVPMGKDMSMWVVWPSLGLKPASHRLAKRSVRSLISPASSFALPSRNPLLSTIWVDLVVRYSSWFASCDLVCVPPPRIALKTAGRCPAAARVSWVCLATCRPCIEPRTRLQPSRKTSPVTAWTASFSRMGKLPQRGRGLQLHPIATAAQKQIDLVSGIEDEPRQPAHLRKAQFGELGTCAAIRPLPLPVGLRHLLGNLRDPITDLVQRGAVARHLCRHLRVRNEHPACRLNEPPQRVGPALDPRLRQHLVERRKLRSRNLHTDR